MGGTGQSSHAAGEVGVWEGCRGKSSTVASPHGINSLPGRVLLLLAHSSGLAKWLKTRPKLTTNTADGDDDGGESRWRQGECHFPDRGACTTAITHGNSLGMEHATCDASAAAAKISQILLQCSTL